MDLVFVRLAEPNDQDTMVIIFPMVGKTFVCGNQQAFLGLRQTSQLSVWNSLLCRAADVERIMSLPLQFLDCDARDVFIHEKLHSVSATSASGVTCSSARLAA